METKQLIEKLSNLKAILYYLSKNYSALYNRISFDGDYYSAPIITYNLEKKLLGLSTYKMRTAELIFPYSNNRLDILKNFIHMFDVKFLSDDDKRFSKTEWYSLLFGWVEERCPDLYNDDLRKVCKKCKIDGHDNDVFCSYFNYFRYQNINVSKAELQIIEDIIENQKLDINKELKLSKNKAIKYREIIKEEIISSDTLIRKQGQEIKKEYGYERLVPRTDKEIEQDKEIKDALSKMYNSVIKEYDMLDKSDWKNIDGIIYMLNTGRADTIKDALNLVDQRMYYEAIVNSITTLNDNVVRALNKIENSINQNFNTLFGKLDITNSQLQYMNNQLGDLKDAYNMSSEKISKDVNKMLDYFTTLEDRYLK